MRCALHPGYGHGPFRSLTQMAYPPGKSEEQEEAHAPASSIQVRPAPLNSARLALIGIGLLSCAPAANARITQIVIKTVESPAFGGRTFGAVGAYERISGHIVGEVDPNDRRNAVIVDIGLAPRNPNGTVSYSTDFQILRPIDHAKGNRRLLYEITNRGRPNALQMLNDSPTANDLTSSGDAGNGFLMRQGYVLLGTGWQTAVPAGNLFHINVPVVRNPDGSPITGPATEELVVDKSATPATMRLTYPAVTGDKSKANLTVRKNYADAPILVPDSDWDFADAKLSSVKLTSGTSVEPTRSGRPPCTRFSYLPRSAGRGTGYSYPGYRHVLALC